MEIRTCRGALLIVFEIKTLQPEPMMQEAHQCSHLQPQISRVNTNKITSRR